MNTNDWLMPRDEIHRRLRAMVEAECERWGTRIKSRQVEAVVEVMADLFFALGQELDAMQRSR